MGVTLLADAALYMALIFGWFYLWTVAPGWQFSPTSSLTTQTMFWGGVPLTLAAACHWLLTQRLRRNNDQHLYIGLCIACGCGILHLVVLGWTFFSGDLAPRTYPHHSVLVVAIAYLVLHSGIATIATGFQALRAKRGYVSAAQPYEMPVLRIFWIYSALTYWLAYTCLALAPLAGAAQ